jgi:hypothetical protein
VTAVELLPELAELAAPPPPGDARVRWIIQDARSFAARAVDRGEGPFDNSFEQVTVRAVWTPWQGWDYLVQYRFRHVERGSLDAAWIGHQ